MPVIAVINRKGGSGKSTLATHLAAYCAKSGIPVMLGDVDRQQSTQAWLRLRKAQSLPERTPIVGWVVDPKNVLRAPAGIAHVVLDTPGGLRGFDLARVVGYADVIVMPVCNSVFDRESAAECYAELMTLPRVASGRCKVAAIGMRLDARTKAGEVLKEWAEQHRLPFIGILRETQAYVRSVERGLTLFDMPASQVDADMEQWAPILEWLKPMLQPAPLASDPVKAPARVLPARPVRPAVSAVPLTASVRREVPAAMPPASLPMAARPRAPAPQAQPASPTLANRIGKMLDALPLRRLLERNS